MYVTDKWKTSICCNIFIVLQVQIHVLSPLSLLHSCCLSRSEPLAFSTLSVPTSQQTRSLKGKELGPTCGHEPRSLSKCQLLYYFSRLPGAYMFRQSRNRYPNIMIVHYSHGQNKTFAETKSFGQEQNTQQATLVPLYLNFKIMDLQVHLHTQ